MQFGEGNRHQVQEAQRMPNKMHGNRPTTKEIIIKISKVKDKERLLKVRENKLITGRLLDGNGEVENG